jgi:two-component system chemotaxis response regulator CheB
MDNPAPHPGPFDVVVLVASAGGIPALTTILSRLPADFPAAVIVLQHLDPSHPSLLAQILGRCARLPVHQARQGDRLLPGAVFVAPPDRHLLVDGEGVISLTETEPVHFVRPSADHLLKSIARSFGRRAVAVVLTGSGLDGAEGIRLIKQMGGTVIAQDRPTSSSFGMPGAAIRTGCVDSILPLGAIASALVHLVTVAARP